jgi:7,8-dihydropterin-6-yl-methyl-4-(beta-D-ribofuranosyl)aminobenzene 5'-phosphate synthase
MTPIRITLLVDHAAAAPDLETEHGLSLLLEAGKDVLLFDAGASGSAFRNAERLGLPWRGISRIVLSHGHRDHTGGLVPFLEALPEADVFLHPRAMSPKWVLHPDQQPRELTMPDAVQSMLWARRKQLHWASAPMRLPGGIGLTGPIPRRHAEEAWSGPFFLGPEPMDPDPLEDDLALWLPSEHGLVVVLGCAHAGVANTLDHVRLVSGENRLAAVIGGLHLGSASPGRLSFALEALRQHPASLLVPLHCTGPAATTRLRADFGTGVGSLNTGESLVFDSVAPDGMALAARPTFDPCAL